jgi:hypothetical protein
MCLNKIFLPQLMEKCLICNNVGQNIGCSFKFNLKVGFEDDESL